MKKGNFSQRFSSCIDDSHCVDSQSRMWSSGKGMDNMLYLVRHECVVRVQETDDVTGAFAKSCIQSE